MKTKVTWTEAMSFIGQTRGLASQFDTTTEYGGHNSAPTPKEAVLNAMCACSGMDVTSLATKMRYTFKKFWMEASAEMTTTSPSYFASVHISYYFEEAREVEKITKAIGLSMNRYCGVSLMISKVCPITYDIIVDGKIIHQDTAKFDFEEIHHGKN